MDEIEEKVQELERELEELRPLKDSSTKLQEEFQEKEATWLKEKAELEQAANPNWSKARKQIENLRKVAEERGVRVDEDGNVLSNPHNVDIEAIRREASEQGAQAAKMELVSNELGKLLNEYDETSQGVIKHLFGKLTTGENVNLSNIKSYFTQAENAAKANPGNNIKKAVQFSGGQGPRSKEDEAIDAGRRQALGERFGFTFAQKAKENKK